MIALEVNNTQYTDFTSISATVSIDSVSGSFSFISASDTITNFPIKNGDECRVLVDGISIITGFIELVEIEYDTSSHVVTISGRDNTCDMIDSTLENTITFSANIGLVDIAKKVLAEAGISIDISTTETIEPFGAGEVESAAYGDGVFGTIERYARKRQVLLTPDGFGNLEFVRAGDVDYGVSLLNSLDAPQDNNIKSAKVFRDDTQRFNTYVVKSQDNVSALPLFGEVKASDIVDNKNEGIIDSEIRTERKLTILAESASDDTQCENRAKWERGVRNARNFGYTAVVQGHSTQFGIWRKNSLVDVEDDFAGVSDKLLVESLTFKYDLTNGSTTEVTCVRKESYTLQEPVPIRQSSTLSFLQ